MHWWQCGSGSLHTLSSQGSEGQLPSVSSQLERVHLLADRKVEDGLCQNRRKILCQFILKVTDRGTKVSDTARPNLSPPREFRLTLIISPRQRNLWVIDGSRWRRGVSGRVPVAGQIAQSGVFPAKWRPTLPSTLLSATTIHWHCAQKPVRSRRKMAKVAILGRLR